MKGSTIGEFEEMVLLVVANLGDQAIGKGIRDEIKKYYNRPLSLSAVYTTLRRLEDKQLVNSQYVIEETKSRGRPKMLFKVTEEGMSILNQIYEVRSKLWEGISFKLR